MIETLSQYVLWWHWIIAGLILIIAEMGTGTFVTLGLGIAAVAVGLLELLFPMNLVFQLLLWILFSLLTIAALFKWFKGQPTVSQSGQSNYRFDTPGTVTQAIHPQQRGKVHFDSPVLGNTEWHAGSDFKLEKGTRVKIVEVNGQLIKVAPLKPFKGE